MVTSKITFKLQIFVFPKIKYCLIATQPLKSLKVYSNVKGSSFDILFHRQN